MELLYGDFKRYFEIICMNESAAKMKPVYDLARKQSFTKSQMALIIGYQAYAAARGKQFLQAAMLALEEVGCAAAIAKTICAMGGGG